MVVVVVLLVLLLLLSLLWLVVVIVVVAVVVEVVVGDVVGDVAAKSRKTAVLLSGDGCAQVSFARRPDYGHFNNQLRDVAGPGV